MALSDRSDGSDASDTAERLKPIFSLQVASRVGEAPVMKLQQGQMWKTSEGYVRIVQLERLKVGYKKLSNLETMEGTHHEATKKEFCRLLKGADLVG